LIDTSTDYINSLFNPQGLHQFVALHRLKKEVM